MTEHDRTRSDLDRRSRAQRAGVMLRLSSEERERLNRLAHNRGVSTNALLSSTVREMLEREGVA